MAETQGLRTRGELADAVGRSVQDASLARRQIIIDAMDLAYLQALESYRWPQLIRWREAAISIAANGDGFIHLPKYLRTLIGFSDTTTPVNVDEWSARPVVELTQGFTSTFGIPNKLTWAGNYGINTILVAGTELRVLSSAADTRTVWIRGRRLSDQQQASVTLNGTTPVTPQVGGSNATWDEVYEFSVVKGSSAHNSNFITIEKTDGTDLGFIERNDLDSVFRRYRIEPIPSGATTVRVVYLETPPTHFDDGQGYLIPITDFLFHKGREGYFESRGLSDRSFRAQQMAEQALLRDIMESGGRRLVVSIPDTPPWRRLVRW